MFIKGISIVIFLYGLMMVEVFFYSYI